MYPLKRVMVGLDLTKVDTKLIKYTRFLCDYLDIEDVYFLHVEPSLEWDEDIAGSKDELSEPRDETLENAMAEEVKNTFSDQKFEVHFEVVEGDPSREILHWAKIKQIDLVIIGKKNDEQGSGVVPEKVSRKAPCSVLIVPEAAKTKLKRILLPIDFSDYSKMVLDEAAVFKRRSPEVELVSSVISRIPTGYYKTGKSLEEFRELMIENSQKKFDKFIAKHKAEKLNIEPIIRCEEKSVSISECITKTADAENIDLIILGAKGQSAASVILLGSVTEKVIRRDRSTPVLIIKKKGETLGFLEALLRV